MMGLPRGRKSFKIGLAVLIQYRRVTDSQPPSHVAVASTRYAYLHRAVKTETQNQTVALASNPNDNSIAT